MVMSHSPPALAATHRCVAKALSAVRGVGVAATAVIAEAVVAAAEAAEGMEAIAEAVVAVAVVAAAAAGDQAAVVTAGAAVVEAAVEVIAVAAVVEVMAAVAAVVLPGVVVPVEGARPLRIAPARLSARRPSKSNAERDERPRRTEGVFVSRDSGGTLLAP